MAGCPQDTGSELRRSGSGPSREVDCGLPLSASAQNWRSRFHVHLWVRASPKAELRVNRAEKYAPSTGKPCSEMKYIKLCSERRQKTKTKTLLCINTTVDLSIETGNHYLLFSCVGFSRNFR